jgi:hypothetical protein
MPALADQLTQAIFRKGGWVRFASLLLNVAFIFLFNSSLLEPDHPRHRLLLVKRLFSKGFEP